MKINEMQYNITWIQNYFIRFSLFIQKSYKLVLVIFNIEMCFNFRVSNNPQFPIKVFPY